MRRYRYISKAPDLSAALADLEGPLALDTEFHAEHRYTPELMLIQVAAREGEVLLIDPVNVGELSELGSLLSRSELITHAGSHDVPLLEGRCGLKAGVVHDTQVMAAFCGFGYPLRLELLLERVLGESPLGGETLSDWSRRPLRKEQLRYAAGDVGSLHRLKDRLEELLDEQGNERREWAKSATAESVEAALATTDPNEAWREIIGARVLNARERGVMKTLCIWREGMAQERNQRPNQIASPSVLLDLSRRRPKSMGALRGNRIFPRGVANRFGEALLEQIAIAEKLPESALPESVALDSREEWFNASLTALGHWIALQRGVAAQLLINNGVRRQLLEAFRGGGGLPDGLGWREEVAGDELRGLLEGRSPDLSALEPSPSRLLLP